MLTFRCTINPHNTLDSLAYYHVGVVKDKLASGNEDGISLDCTSAVIAMAFGTEALLNYIGAKRVDGWRERAPFKTKLSCIEARFAFRFDKSTEPFKTILLLKQARDAMAHGQPVEFQVKVQNDKHVGSALQPTWASVTKPEFVLAAHERYKQFKQELFKRARIKPGAALTGAIGGG